LSRSLPRGERGKGAVRQGNNWKSTEETPRESQPAYEKGQKGMDKGGTRPTSEDPGARETGSLLRTFEDTSVGNTEKVQTLRKKLTLSSSDRRRRGEVESVRRPALDLGWLLVTEERTEDEEEVLEKNFQLSHQATSGVTGKGGELMDRKRIDRKSKGLPTSTVTGGG